MKYTCEMCEKEKEGKPNKIKVELCDITAEYTVCDVCFAKLKRMFESEEGKK